jgi:putative membrane protein
MKAITRVLFIALLGTSAAYAEDTAKTNDTSKTKTTDTSKTAKKEKLTANELQVMAHYHAVNQMEIDLGMSAQKMGGTQAVKSYGEMMVKDHGDFDKQLTALAKKTGQTIPAEKPATDADKQAKADEKKQAMAVKKMKGADFDREYLRMMVDGHDKELSQIDTKMADVQNTELADALRSVKSTLQHHADQARELQKTSAEASTTPPSTSPTKSASATQSQPKPSTKK